MVRKTSRNVGRSTLTHKSQLDRKTHRQHCQARTIMTRSQCTTITTTSSSSSSFFNRIPVEVFEMILDKLSVLDMSVFSMVSKEITRYVMDYISTRAWKNKMIIQGFHHSTCLDKQSIIGHYSSLGLLFKRCTLLLPTKDRLKFIFSKFSQVPCFTLEQCLRPDCAAFSSYGICLQTLIAGWEEMECYRVFSYLCDATNLLQKVEAVLAAKPGVRWQQELDLRLFCRQVLLDPWLNPFDCQFWLKQLLKPWPMVSQAHLLLILYGPVLPEGTLGWQDLVQRGLSHGILWDLAKAVRMLFCKLEVKGWTTDSVLPIFEELTVIPQPWHLLNIARLLVLCGNSICYTVLASKALSGQLYEISRLIVYIILVCEKEDYTMSWAVELVQQICKVFSSAHEKFCFIQHLENAFSEVIREFFEFSVAENNFEDMATFQALLHSSARFHSEFLCMFLK